MTDADSRAQRGHVRLLSDRRVAPYYYGNVASNSGTWVQNIASAVVVYDLTGSSLMVGAVGAAQFAPPLLLAPVAGRLADRMNRRTLLILTQAASGVTALLLAGWALIVGLNTTTDAVVVFTATMVIGSLLALAIPAMQAIVAGLVPATQLDQAVALNSVTFNLARAIGPAIGAAALVLVGPAGAFLLNAVTFLIFVAALFAIHPYQASSEQSLEDRKLGGLRIAINSGLAIPLLAVGVLGFSTDPAFTLGPAIADVFGGGEALVGLLVAAFGGGAVIASIVVGRLRSRYRSRSISTAGLLVLGGGTLGVALIQTPGAAVVGFGVAGAGFLVGLSSLTAQILQTVPDHFRGRVMAIWSLAFLGSRPLASLTNGALSDFVGPHRAMLAAPLLAAVAAAVLLRQSETKTADAAD